MVPCKIKNRVPSLTMIETSEWPSISTNYTTYVCYFLEKSVKMSDQKPSCSDDPNDRLNLHDWVDNSVELERTTHRNQNTTGNNLQEQIAVVFTRATMQGMPMDQDFTDNPEMTNAIGMSKMLA